MAFPDEPLQLSVATSLQGDVEFRAARQTVVGWFVRSYTDTIYHYMGYWWSGELKSLKAEACVDFQEPQREEILVRSWWTICPKVMRKYGYPERQKNNWTVDIRILILVLQDTDTATNAISDFDLSLRMLRVSPRLPPLPTRAKLKHCALFGVYVHPKTSNCVS